MAHNVVPINQVVLPRWVGGAAVLALGGILLLLVAFTSFFTIPAESVGVVTRFGKYVRQADPGLHFKLPLGIDHAIRVPVNRQLKQEFGFQTEGGGSQTRYSQADFSEESLMITGDLNAVDVEWIVQYRIQDAKAFTFNVSDPEATLRAASEAVMREVVGDRTVDEVLTIGRSEMEDQSRTRMQEMLDQFDMGLGIEQVALQDINPPVPVQSSFNEVNQAQQEKEKLINEAHSEYNRVVPRAEGEAQQKISEAEGYAMQRVNESQGDAARFSALLAEFERAPAVTRRRMYLETMGKVIPRLGSKVVVDDAVRQFLPLMALPAGQPVPTAAPTGGDR